MMDFWERGRDVVVVVDCDDMMCSFFEITCHGGLLK